MAGNLSNRSSGLQIARDFVLVLSVICILRSANKEDSRIFSLVISDKVSLQRPRFMIHLINHQERYNFSPNHFIIILTCKHSLQQ